MANSNYTPSLYREGNVVLQAAPVEIAIASSGGQGNVGPCLFLELASGQAIRADENTTKANILGFCFDIKTATGGVPVPPDYIANNTAGYASYGSAALARSAGTQFILGEDGDGTTLAAVVAAAAGATVYVDIINQTDVIGDDTYSPQVVLKQVIDSSTGNTTQSNRAFQVVGQAPLSNAIPPNAPATNTSIRNWILVLAPA